MFLMCFTRMCILLLLDEMVHISVKFFRLKYGSNPIFPCRFSVGMIYPLLILEYWSSYDYYVVYLSLHICWHLFDMFRRSKLDPICLPLLYLLDELTLLYNEIFLSLVTIFGLNSILSNINVPTPSLSNIYKNN